MADAPEDRPLRKDAERNRRRILEAAADLFAARGLDVTMDDIADHAGVGVGTVYRRFSDKELLIDALFEDRIGDVLALAEQALEADDPWDGLVGFMERSVELQAQDRGLKELLFGAAHGRERVARGRELIKPKVGQVLARAQASGDVRADLATADVPLTLIMLGTIADYAREVEPQQWKRQLALVLDGLRPARDAPTPLPLPPLDDAQMDVAMQRWRP
jgi:AcrR family transcriptional regulator